MLWLRFRLRARARVKAWWIVRRRLKSNHFSKNYELTSIRKNFTLSFEFMKIFLIHLARFSTWQFFSTWRFFVEKSCELEKLARCLSLNFLLMRMENNHFFYILNRCFLDSHAPDRFTPSRARCVKNCGAALTHRLFGKKWLSFFYRMMWLKVGQCEFTSFFSLQSHAFE